MEQQVKTELKKLSGHECIELTSRGNTAIFAALYCARKLQLDKKIVLMADQGGWFTYKKYAKMLDLIPIELETDYGIIDLSDLEEKAPKANCIIYSEPAGYFAEQPVKKIFEICKKNKVTVILDITGSIGKEFLGEYADFCLASFGKDKPVNLGYGGFVSAKKDSYFAREIFRTVSFDNSYLPDLLKNLKNLKQRYTLFEKADKKIKNDLKDFEILHKGSDGVNVVVKFKDEKEKEQIIDYCNRNNYEYTLCPRYIRVNCNAVSIEVKRLQPPGIQNKKI
jgi:hypothetical protein